MQIWDMVVKRFSAPDTSSHSQIIVHIGGNGWRRLGSSETFQRHERMEGFNLIPKKRIFLYRRDDTGPAPHKTNSLIIIIIIIIITRSLRKNLETVPGKHSIDSLQKTAMLGKSHIIRKVLQCET